MIVALQTTPGIGSDLRQSTPKQAASHRVLAIVQQFQSQLQPTFPQGDDPELNSHFFVEIADPDEAETLVASLMKTPGVEAAYLKPREEAPW